MSDYDALIGPSVLRPPTGAGLSRDARLLNVEAYVWSRQNLTDGRIPAKALRWVTDAEHPEALAAELVGAELWDAVAGGWEIVDFSATQMSSERVRARKQQNTERYDRWIAGQGGKRQRAGKRADSGAANAVANDAELTRTDRVGKLAASGSAGAPPSAATCERCDRTDTRAYKGSGNLCPDHALTSDDERVARMWPGMSGAEYDELMDGGVFVDTPGSGYPAGWWTCDNEVAHEGERRNDYALFPEGQLTERGDGQYCQACIDSFEDQA